MADDNDDITEKYITNIQQGNPANAITVRPIQNDIHESYVSKIAGNLLGNRTAKVIPGERYEERTKNMPGHVIETPGWNTEFSTINGMLQGYFPEALAYSKSLVSGRSYADEFTDIKQSQLRFGQQNPGANAIGEIGGSLVTAIPLMAAGQEYVAAPLASRIAAAAPRIGGAITDFLGGASKGLLAPFSQAVRGAAEGAESAVIPSGLSDKPLSEQVKTGALVGGVANPAIRALMGPLASHINPTTAESAQALIDQGVPVRTGQVPGANKVTALMDKIFSGKSGQGEAFSDALSTHAGMPTKEINQDWVEANDKRIGNIMNQIQSVYAIPRNEMNLSLDLLHLRSQAHMNLLPANAAKVDAFVDKIEQAQMQPGGITGTIYKNITQKGGILDNMSKDPDIKQYSSGVIPNGKSLRDILDDAWGRALPSDKKAAWDQARKEYKVTRTIDDSMGVGGAAEGKYNPQKLLKAVESRYGNVNNAGDLGMLARGGQFLAPEGSKATALHTGPASLIGKGVALGAGAVAAGEGARAIHHFGPEMLASIVHNPESYAIPALLAGAGIGVGKATNWMLNGPGFKLGPFEYNPTKYALDVARGIRRPVLGGVNPALPFLVEGANR